MNPITIAFTFLWIARASDDYPYYLNNVTRNTLPGLLEYRSALTLDWLAVEDLRQRELAAVFETEATLSTNALLASECMEYPKPAGGKVAALIFELMKNVEGDNAKLLSALKRTLYKSKMLVETSVLDMEPDLTLLLKTPAELRGEPYVNFPRIMTILWLLSTDPSTVHKYGWCPVNQVIQYLSVTKPSAIAKHMRALEPIAVRTRFIIEDFINSVIPLDVYSNKMKYKFSSKPSLRQRVNAVSFPIRLHSPAISTEIYNMKSFPNIFESKEKVAKNDSISTSVGNILFYYSLFCAVSKVL
ncbi:hypothetical protein ACJJTC_014482 [Scirpophaga incertulas]